MGLKESEQIDMGDHLLQYYELDVHNRLELIEYKYSVENRTGQPSDSMGIYRHMAICVEGMDELYDKVSRETGIQILSKPKECKKLNFRNFLFLDPNGVEIEVVERNR